MEITRARQDRWNQSHFAFTKGKNSQHIIHHNPTEHTLFQLATNFI